jgi:hypothetical protein
MAGRASERRDRRASFPASRPGEYAALRPIAALLGEKVARCRAVFYTVSVSNTPKTIDAVLGLNLIKLGYARLTVAGGSQDEITHDAARIACPSSSSTRPTA